MFQWWIFLITIMKLQNSINRGGGFLVRCFRFRASSFEIFGGQSGTESDFSPSTSIFPCRYHFTIAPHSSSSTCCCYKKDKWTKPGNIPKSNPLSEIVCKKYFHFVFRGLDKSFQSLLIFNIRVFTAQLWGSVKFSENEKGLCSKRILSDVLPKYISRKHFLK